MSLPDETAPFTEIWPRSEARDQALRALPRFGVMARAALYLSTGRFLPQEAKRASWRFGFCDEAGRCTPAATATHVGWTVEEVANG